MEIIKILVGIVNFELKRKINLLVLIYQYHGIMELLRRGEQYEPCYFKN